MSMQQVRDTVELTVLEMGTEQADTPETILAVKISGLLIMNLLSAGILQPGVEWKNSLDGAEFTDNYRETG